MTSLNENELKSKIDKLLADMEYFEHLTVDKRKILIKDFIAYKGQIQKRCKEKKDTLLAMQNVMKEVSPDLFPEDPPNACKEENKG